MIVDCFTFFNELDLLEGRLEYLYDTVDYFVIVEADVTHSGQPKPLNYLENISRYHKFSDKILYFPVHIDVSAYDWSVKHAADDMTSPHWQVENLQRNHIATALKLFDPQAWIMIGDLDEIPNRDVIQYAISCVNDGQPMCTFRQDMFYYNFNQKQIGSWPGTVVTTNSIAVQYSPQQIREARWSLPGVSNGGWHLAYWGSPEKIKYKLENFAHQEYNSSEFTDTSKIAERMAAGADLFGRGDHYQFIPVDRSLLPADVLGVFGKYEIINLDNTMDQPKNLVLGIALGYGVNEIKNFILSFREYNQQDHVNLIIDQATLDKTQDFLKSQNIDVTLFDLQDAVGTTPVNNLRFEQYRKILTQGTYKNILSADIRDVIFQKDPFANLPDHPYLYLFQEDSGVTIGQEVYNSLWIKNAYGDQILDQIKDQLVICVGTVMASAPKMLEYVDFVTAELKKFKERSPDVWRAHAFEQAPGMYLGYAREQKIQGLEIKPSGHIVGTIGLSLTHHLARDQIEGRGDGFVYVNGLVPEIIHQYDRHGELVAFFNQKYSMPQS
jgi:beta-1,4-mannosyl-glycoprotein beta-1,4-N-acetylglucosaminyltransferase